MGSLQDFQHKDLVEQITILDEVRASHEVAAIPHLMELYVNPLGDQVVDEMVYHTLYDLLEGQDDRIIEGLDHETSSMRLLCIRRAAESASPAVKGRLVDLLSKTDDVELLGEIIRALANFKDPALLDTLLAYLRHEDYTVVAWAMRALVNLNDPKARDALLDLIEASAEVQGDVNGCDLRTALAVENLVNFPDAKTIEYLIGHIHHANPSFRRVVISTLSAMGDKVLPALEACLEKGDKDERIMAANILGLAGMKKGADILVSRLERAAEPNLRFAIYEALGRINSIRSIIGLTDGLAEQDELVLIAVVTGLDHLCNPGVVKVVNEALSRADAQSGHLAKAIVTARAGNLFAAVYAGGEQAETLLEAVRASGDAEAAAMFRKVLEGMESEKAAADAKRLGAEKAAPGPAKRLLAADDSKAMLFFYKGVAVDLGLELVAVSDGKQAHEHLRQDDNFDLIITDMNMPTMDGIELTRTLRKMEGFADKPILMATTESEKSQSDLAIRAGVTDFITKPFTKEDFKAKIENLLN